MPSPSSRPIGFSDARVGAATVAAAALVSCQVVGRALRDTLFLSTFAIERLPLAMIGAAVVSGVVVLFVSRAASMRSPHAIVRATLLVSTVLFASGWALATRFPNLVAAATYLHAGALSAAAVSAFWSLVTESFDPYTARAAIPRVMAGATFGGVVGGLATWRVAAHLEPKHLLLAAAVLHLASVGAIARFPATGRGRPARDTQWSFGTLARELTYLRALALLVALGALTQALLDFLLSESAVRELGRGPQLLSFFALFQTAVGVLSFLLQAVVSRSALERFGVGVALGAPPALLLGGVAATSVANPLIASVVLRALDGILGASLHRSGYEVLFAPLQATKRRAVKPVLDVGFDRLGTLAGSGLLALLAVTELELHRLLIGVVVALALARIALAPLLQTQYRRTLADNLRRHRGPTAPRRADAALTLGASLAAFNLPAGPELDELESSQDHGGADDTILTNLRELRSGDPERIAAVLRARHNEPLLAPQVITLLANDTVAQAAADWLIAQEPRPTGMLGDALLDDHEPEKARRRAARVLGKLDDPRAVEALILALDKVPTAVRTGVTHALARSATRHAVSRGPLLRALVRVAGEARDDGEANRLEELFFLLAAAYPKEPIEPAMRALARGGDARGTALEWLDMILPRDVKIAVWPVIARSGDHATTIRRNKEDLERVLLSVPLGASALSDDSDR